MWSHHWDQFWRWSGTCLYCIGSMSVSLTEKLGLRYHTESRYLWVILGCTWILYESFNFKHNILRASKQKQTKTKQKKEHTTLTAMVTLLYTLSTVIKFVTAVVLREWYSKCPKQYRQRLVSANHVCKVSSLKKALRHAIWTSKEVTVVQ